MVFHGQPLEAMLPFLSGERDFTLFHMTVPGLLITFFGIFKWALEGPGGYHVHPPAGELEAGQEQDKDNEED
jgi:hypothetical protein